MYINSAYLNNSLADFKDKSKPLIVRSCGTYHLFTRPKLPTWRPRGRIDFQLLYIASGKAHFFFDGKEEIVTAGNMVLYRPKEEQHYIYYGVDKTEVYWVHFTGSNVTNILKHYGIGRTGHVFYTGTDTLYPELFKQMIQELQLCRQGFEELLTIYLRQILIHMQRQLSEGHTVSSYIQEEIKEAVRYFNEHYNETLSIEDYAHSRNMSTSWFIRNFKQLTGSTPMQYILSIRITNAQILLETTSYNISEITEILGYDNPLYFSRIFKKQKGLSPSEYRKMIHKENG